jgi:AcrR family transcriptional regulator
MTGRPPRRSRAEITAAAVAIADRDGIEAASMRQVAAALGTGAASLYRYVQTREDLLDLMTDSMAAEYVLGPPTGDWIGDLVDVGQQAREIMRRHPWLADLTTRRPALGPRGLALLEHVLEVLAPFPASAAAKLESFAVLMAITAVFVQAELGGDAPAQRSAAYLQEALASGEYPRLGELLADAAPPPADPPPNPADRFGEILARILAGLLGPGPG